MISDPEWSEMHLKRVLGKQWRLWPNHPPTMLRACCLSQVLGIAELRTYFRKWMGSGPCYLLKVLTKFPFGSFWQNHRQVLQNHGQVLMFLSRASWNQWVRCRNTGFHGCACISDCFIIFLSVSTWILIPDYLCFVCLSTLLLSPIVWDSVAQVQYKFCAFLSFLSRLRNARIVPPCSSNPISESLERKWLTATCSCKFQTSSNPRAAFHSGATWPFCDQLGTGGIFGRFVHRLDSALVCTGHVFASQMGTRLNM